MMGRSKQGTSQVCSPQTGITLRGHGMALLRNGTARSRLKTLKYPMLEAERTHHGRPSSAETVMGTFKAASMDLENMPDGSRHRAIHLGQAYSLSGPRGHHQLGVSVPSEFPKWWYCGHQLGKKARETVKHLCPEENHSRTVFSYPRSKE